MAQRIDALLEVPPTGHIEWGTPFMIPPGIVQNCSKPYAIIDVQPEVTTINDEDGKPLTMKVVFHLDPPLLDPETNEPVDSIALGSFGQDDPLRLYYTSIFATKILNSPDFLMYKIQEAARVYKNDPNGKLIRLEELLYSCLNASFLAKPDSVYNEGNIHNLINWDPLPATVMAEIGRRVKENLPLNYMYLAHVIENGGIPELTNADFAVAITARAMTQLERSTDEKIAYWSGKYGIRMDQNEAYDEAARSFSFVDFEVLFEGRTIVDNRVFEWIDTSLRTELHIVSDIPAVNAAHRVISTIMHLIYNEFDNYGVNSGNIPHTRLNIAADFVRETLIRRIYKAFTEGLPELKMTLGEFASQVYELTLNNNDPNLIEYLIVRDDAETQFRATKGES